MTTISIILAGFTVCSALILLAAYLFFLEDMRKSISSKCACAFMLLGLAALQNAHLNQFLGGGELLETRYYCVLLASLPVAFFFFSREVLFADSQYQARDFFHTVPLFLGITLPISMVPALSFVIGTMYTLWLAGRLFLLREQRRRFKIEMFFFSLFALMTIAALVLGLSLALALPVLDTSLFYIAYANTISIAMVLVLAALLVFPDLLTDLVSITEISYANSKLQGVDCDAKLQHLGTLMVDERQFENESLKLATVAESVGLSSHQLSELINTHFGYGFPRFLREHRVEAAKVMLLAEPDASILSISLATGFRSQSSFYAAFKELVGQTPADYRVSATSEL